jgi:hypothetical protein
MGVYRGVTQDNVTINGGTAYNLRLINGSASSPTPVTAAGNVNADYVTASHASGDVRLEYDRLDITSTGSGETLRAFTRVSGANAATGGTVNGAHISLSVNSGGTISGAGNALRVTLGAAAGVSTGGTVAALQLDSDLAATSSVPATAAFMRVTDTNSVKVGKLLNIPAPANSTIFATHTTQAMTHSIRICAEDGTPYFIMCTNAATNRGGSS